MDADVREIYLELWTLCVNQERPLLHRYRSLRASFERVIREQMQMSKNEFKRAVGHLLKLGKIESGPDSIRMK